MTGAVSVIPKPSLLWAVIDLILESQILDRGTKSELYEYTLIDIIALEPNGK